MHHAIPALPTDRSYWASMSYKALYWWPALKVWTENARQPADGGIVVEIDVISWSALNCLEEAALKVDQQL